MKKFQLFPYPKWIILALVSLFFCSNVFATRNTVSIKVESNPKLFTISQANSEIDDEFGNEARTLIDYPDSYCSGEEGWPAIPVRPYNIAVPLDACNFKITFKVTKKESINTLSYPLSPILRIPTSFIQEPSTNFLSELNCDWPEWDGIPKARMLADRIVNGCQRVVTIGVETAGYRHCDTTLHTYSEGMLSLEYSEQGGGNPHRVLKAPRSVLDTDLEKYVANPEFIKNIARVQPPLPGGLDNKGFYLIVCPDSLCKALQPLAQWKTQKGYKTRVVPIESILSSVECTKKSNSTIVDDASAFREWLCHEFESYGTFHLLIVGDRFTEMPVRKYYYQRDPDKPEELPIDFDAEYYIPSDSYFSDLTTDYTLEVHPDGHHYVIKTHRKIPFFSPLLPVGRLLAHTEEQIGIYTAKLLNYELNPGLGHYEYLGKGLHTQQYDAHSWHSKSIFETLPALNLRQFIDSVGGTVFETNSPTGKEVLDVLGDHGIVSLQGHGSPNTIAVAGSQRNYANYRYMKALEKYTGTQVDMNSDEKECGFDLMNNPDKPNFIYSLACTTSPFDRVRRGKLDDNYELNVGASLTVGGNYGSVAFIGNTRNGFFTDSSYMEKELGKGLSQGFNLGNAFTASFSASDYWPAHLARTIIGEPELTPWISLPARLDIRVVDTNGECKVAFAEEADLSISNGIDASVFLRQNSNSNISLNLLSETVYSDFVATISNAGRLPETILFGKESVSRTGEKHYFLNEGNIWPILPTDHFNFILPDRSSMLIDCLGNFNTHHSFDLHGGNLTINAVGSAILKGDLIGEGSKLEITGNEVILDAGFTAEIGAELIIKPRQHGK